MKKKFAIIFYLLLSVFEGFSQNDPYPVIKNAFSVAAQSKELNFHSYTVREQLVSEKWKKQNTKYFSHPDAGYIAAEQPPGNVIELFEKRSETTRFYVDSDNPSRVFSQGAYGSLHYKKNGQWLIIDSRLTKKSKDILEASRQMEPVGFDLQKRRSYLRTANGIIYFNDWKVTGTTGMKSELLSTANWDDYKAGDDGVFVKNIFPGIDAEMKVLRGRVKTNLIVRSWHFPQFDQYQITDDFHTTKNGVFNFVNDSDEESGVGQIDFKVESKLLARVDRAVLYQEKNPENVIYLPYKIENQTLGMVIEKNTITALLKNGNVIIDPMVVGPQGVYTPGTLLNSYNNANCSYDFNLGCSYDWTVPVPPFITVTNIYLINRIETLPPCTRDKMRFRFGFGDQLCGNDVSWLTIGLPPTPGITGGNTSISSRYNDCIQSGCTQKDVKVTMSIIRGCMGPPGCESSCVQGVGPFVTTIEGRTIELTGLTSSTENSNCPGDPIVLSATADFGIKPYTFLWNPVSIAGNNLTVNPILSTYYTVTIRDACNQSVSGSKLVNVPPAPPAMTVNISPSETTICQGKFIRFLSAVTNVDSPVYQWKINGLDIPGATSSDFATCMIADSDLVSLVVNNPAACPNPKTAKSNEIKIKVIQLVVPSINITSNSLSNTVCKGMPLQFTATTINSSSSPQYQWFKNGISVGTGLYTYQDTGLNDQDVISCLLTSNSQCAQKTSTKSNEITVAVNDNLFVDIIKTVCPGALPYQWNGYSISMPGKAVAVFTSKSRTTGCDSTTTLSMLVFPPPQLSKIDTSGCGSIVFKGKTYMASTTTTDTIKNQAGCDSLIQTVNMVVYSNSPVYQELTLAACDSLAFEGIIYHHNTTVKRMLKSTYGCDSIQQTIQIIVEKFKLELFSAGSNTLYNGDLISLTTSSTTIGYKITGWQPHTLFQNQFKNFQNIRAMLLDTIFTVFGISLNGCVDSASLSVNVLPKPFGKLLPEVFTPNNDGHNDSWAPLKGDIFPVGELFVYNRWGECIYHTMDYILPWDGKHKNSRVPSGYYPYRLIISRKFEVFGSVLILY